MPKTSIYINQDDEALFARAKELAGDSLSPVIATALRSYVAAKEAELAGHKEVTIEVGTWRKQGADDIRKVRFLGRLLSQARVYRGQTSDRRDRHTDFTIYQTVAGKIIIHTSFISLWEREGSVAQHDILDRLPAHGDEIDGWTIPGSLLDKAAAALGQELVEWVE